MYKKKLKDIKSVNKLWVVISITLIGMAVILVLEIQSLNSAVDATLQEFNQRQLV